MFGIYYCGAQIYLAHRDFNKLYMYAHNFGMKCSVFPGQSTYNNTTERCVDTVLETLPI